MSHDPSNQLLELVRNKPRKCVITPEKFVQLEGQSDCLTGKWVLRRSNRT